MNNVTKQILAGTLLGLMVTGLGAIIFVFILLPVDHLNDVFSKLINSGIITKIITLGALPNVIVFQLLIKNNRIYIARGVLMAVVLLAVVFAFLKVM